MEYLAKSAHAGESPVSLQQHTLDVIRAGLAILESLPLSSEERDAFKSQLIPVLLCHDWGKVIRDFQRVLRGGGRPKHGFRHEIASIVIALCLLELTPSQQFAVLTHHKACWDTATTRTASHFPLEQFQFDASDPKDDRWLDPATGWLSDIQSQWNELQTHLIAPLQRELQRFGWDAWVRWLPHSQPPQTLHFRPYRPYIKIDHTSLPYASNEQKLGWAKLRGLTIAADHLGSAQHCEPLPVVHAPEPTTFLPPGQKLYPYQEALLQSNSHLLLRAPTGSGKTEALLCWLHANWQPNQRVLYTLPYTASSNAMHRRLCKAFDNPDAVGILHSKATSYLFSIMEAEPALSSEATSQHEEHSSNLPPTSPSSTLATEDTSPSSHERAKAASNRVQLAREIFFPVKVCTPHQILRYSLCGKGWEMGLLDLFRSRVIFDEFHTYDPRLTGLLLATARWMIHHLEAKVAFVSATIPSFLKALIAQHLPEIGALTEPNPQQPQDAMLLQRKRHRIFMHPGTLLDTSVWRALTEAIEQKQRVLIVVNNVRTAQEIALRLRGIPPEDWPFDHKLRTSGHPYSLCNTSVPSDDSDFFEANADSVGQISGINGDSLPCPGGLEPFEVVLLHSAFHAKDRRRIEHSILSAVAPRVLVATQAIEVSLDIDYDIAFIEAAPIDALIQRFGRVNRAGRRPPADIHLVRHSIGKTPFYPKRFLDNTWAALRPLVETPLAESDLIAVCDEVYKDGYQGEDLELFSKALRHSAILHFERSAIPGFHNQRWVDEIIEPTSIEIFPGASLELRQEYQDLVEQGRWIEARERLVPVSFSLLRRAGASCSRHERTEVWIHDAIAYDSTLGAYIEAHTLFDDRSF